LHFRSDIRWLRVLLPALIALGGCGTFSGAPRNSSSLLATAPPSPVAVSVAAPMAPAAGQAAATEDSPSPAAQPGAADPQPTVAAQSDAPEPAPSLSSIAFEPIPVSLAGFSLFAETPSTDGLLMSQATRESSAAPSDAEPQEYDPWEPFNEKMFTFNYNFDKYLLKPVAKGYNFVVPDEIQRMIANGFDNINPVPKWVNNLLQRNFTGFFTEVGRFVINSTFGIGGLFDIAKQEFGLQKTKVDFGQTLGKWGVQPGPYLILPFLPPLTVRDGIGYGVDGAMDPLSYVLPFIWDRLGMKIGDTINDRSLNLDLFQGFEETTIDLYSAVRNGYLQRRYNLIHNPPPPPK
jgi:phospholipid-binding lipoprotein MlaA